MLTMHTILSQQIAIDALDCLSHERWFATTSSQSPPPKQAKKGMWGSDLKNISSVKYIHADGSR
jgi:hypothetical protein